MDELALDNFDRESGSGSNTRQEEWLDENSTACENQWSTANTTFYYWEAAESEKFEELYDKHHGKGESDRKTTIRQSNIMSDVQTFTDVLEMPNYQRERVELVVEEMDLSSNETGGKSYEKIILAVCSLVADEELSKRPDASLDDRLLSQDEFKHLMGVNDMSSREHNQLRQMLRENSDYFSTPT